MVGSLAHGIGRAAEPAAVEGGNRGSYEMANVAALETQPETAPPGTTACGYRRLSDKVADALALNETDCAANPLGVKGCGEAGAIGAPPAVINAVVDALAALGITHVDMPATPETVWRIIRGATIC